MPPEFKERHVYGGALPSLEVYGSLPFVLPAGVAPDVPIAPGAPAPFPTPAPIFPQYLPDHKDLTTDFPPAGFQGYYENSCTAFATAWTLSYLARLTDGRSLRDQEGRISKSSVFSPSFIYNQLNYSTGPPPTFANNGLQVNAALDFVRKYGAATLSDMDYTAQTVTSNDQLPTEQANEIGNWSRLPGPTASTHAVAFKISAAYGATDTSVDVIKRWLLQNRPVILVIAVTDSLENIEANNYIWSSPGKIGSSTHSVVVVGYDDAHRGTNGALRILNSWGSDWGDHGTFWMTYDVAANKQVVKAAFVVGG